MNELNNIDNLILEYLQGSITEDDKKILLEWVNFSLDNYKLFERSIKSWNFILISQKYNNSLEMEKRILQKIFRRKGGISVKWVSGIASSFLLLISLFFLLEKKEDSNLAVQSTKTVNYEPGSPKAYLIIDDLNEFELSLSKIGDPLGIDGYINDSLGLHLTPIEFSNSQHTRVNKIVVPDGGEYYVTLSDGTKVWINSGSEIVFPSYFRKDKREIKLKGEAYFEVVSDINTPFQITTDKMTVDVLGTNFNVMAYPNGKDYQIALLSGKISLTTERGQTFEFFPGNIGTYNILSGETKIVDGNVEAIAEWRDGIFNFNDLSLEDLILRLSRWYNVKFEFIDERAKTLKFTGAAMKYRSLSYVLNIISMTTQVNFYEDGNVIKISSEHLY